MARDGQGNYNPPLNNWNPALDGNEADPASWNQLLADLTSALSQSVSSDGQTMLTGNLKMGGNTLQGMGAPSANGQALRRDQLIKGPNIESASTITIPAEGSVFEVTGTATINQMSGAFDGRMVVLVFQDELTIKHGPNLQLPNATDIATKAGDAFVFYRKTSSGWAALYGTAATRNVGTEPGEVPTNSDLRLRENVKVTVGAGGDFPTINAAVLHLSRFTPDLGVTAEVELMSGFVMSEQLLVDGLDLGWITITGVDAETVINEPSLTRVLALDVKPAFGVENGTLPTIGQLFSFSSKGSPDDLRSGVCAYNVGRASILDGCGVKNVGHHGIQAVGGSTINASDAVASGAGNHGVAASSSTINAAGVDASGAGGTGVGAYEGSTINAANADASGAGDNGIYATQGSSINATGVDASGAGGDGIATNSGSTINARSATGTLSQAKNTVTTNGIIFQT